MLVAGGVAVKIARPVCTLRRARYKLRVFIRSGLLGCLLAAFACTPGGAGSTADSSGGASETGAVTSGSTAAGTSGPTNTGSDPTAGSTGGEGGSTSTTPATTSTTTGSSTGDASTGGDGLGTAALAAIDALDDAVAGVTWPSESDYPWTVFGLVKAAPVTADNLVQLVGAMLVVDDGEPPLEQQTVVEEPWEERFVQLTTPQVWWTDYEYMRAEQYEAIRATLKQHLVELKLFRIGPDDGQGTLTGAIDMFVIGATADGDLVGIQTVSVET